MDIRDLVERAQATLGPQKVPCPAALNIAGQHFDCDWPTDEKGQHKGWAHSNKEAQAIWTADRNDV